MPGQSLSSPSFLLTMATSAACHNASNTDSISNRELVYSALYRRYLRMRNRFKSTVTIMAAIKEFGDEISDQFLVCKICFETYRNPKSLSCLHTFCASCLEQYLKAELARTQYRYVIYARGITCPVCRKRTELPSGGVRHLPDNFLVSNLTEVVNRSKPTTRSPMCELCLHAGRPSKVAQSKCVECNKTMCRKCLDVHQRTKVTRNHTTYPIKAENNVVCRIHEDEPLRFFCQPCEICICVACTFREHYGHDVTSFGEGISQYADEMERLTSLCKSKMTVIQSHLDAINRCESNMSRVEDHIKTLASNLIVNIRIKQRILLDEIRQFYGSESLELVDNKEELEQILENLSSTCDLANFVLNDKDVEFLLLHKQVCDKMKSLIDLDLAQLPDSMFDELKFVQGGMFFGYLDTGRELKEVEYDVKPSESLPQVILDRLAVTSSIQETQTGLESLLDASTTMNSSVASATTGVQTDEPIVQTKRGQTQTQSVSTRTAGTVTEAPLFRSRSQNTERRDSLYTNCASQTNIELVDAMSRCHPVLSVSEDSSETTPRTQTVSCGTEISTASSSTTTEDLEMELITKYLELMESGDPHSPPYNIPFPVDFLDRCSPTSESLPLLTHIINTVQKVDQCTNVPSVTDITNGSEIEVTDVMLKDSSTNTDEPVMDITNPHSVYTYSDSYEESSPEEGETSADTSQDSISPISDEDKYTDQSTLIDREDLIQILAGEELVQWDEQSALYDMIVLDRMHGKKYDLTDSSVNTDLYNLSSGDSDEKVGDENLAPIASGQSDPRVVQWTTVESDFHYRQFDGNDSDQEDLSSSETETNGLLPKRKTSLETGDLTGKLESLFSMSKLLAMTKKLDRRPSQSSGMVSEVTRKLERRISTDGPESGTQTSSPQRRTSNTRRPTLEGTSAFVRPGRDVYIFAPSASSSPSNGSPPPPPSTDAISSALPSLPAQSSPRPRLTSTQCVFSYKKENEASATDRVTIGRRRQLARVRKPDISALLNLDHLAAGQRSPETLSSEGRRLVPEGRLVPGTRTRSDKAT